MSIHDYYYVVYFSGVLKLDFWRDTFTHISSQTLNTVLHPESLDLLDTRYINRAKNVYLHVSVNMVKDIF